MRTHYLTVEVAIWRAAKHAGLPARLEEQYLLPDDPDKRPGDVVISGYGKDGKTLVIDVTVLDTFAKGYTSDSVILKDPTAIPRAAERRKRNNKDNNDPTGTTMEERLRKENKTFMPIAFTTSGTETSSFGKLITKLSEIANARLGYDKQYFATVHRTTIGCAFHRALATAFTRKARSLLCHGHAYGAPFNEPPLTIERRRSQRGLG